MIRFIEDAITAHSTWVSEFIMWSKGINTQLIDVNIARNSSLCALGQWLDSTQSDALLANSEKQKIIQLHQYFHDIAGEIALYTVKNNIKMVNILIKELTKQSEFIISELNLINEKNKNTTYLPF